MQSHRQRPPLTLSTSLSFGIGSVAFGIHRFALGSLLLLFFNQVVGLPAAWVSAAMMVTLIFDAICDPLIGGWSDRTHSRWGRRHPFMYASALPVAISFYLLWNPPRGWSNGALLGYLVVALIAVRLLLSFYEIPSHALAPELTLDYDQRTSLISWRFFFGTIGGGAMAVLAFAFFLRKNPSHPLGLMNRAGYQHYALVAGVVMCGTILISCLGTHRFIASLSQNPARWEGWRDTWREVRGTFSNRAFVALMVAGVFGAVATGVRESLGIYLDNYFWELSPRQMSYFAGITPLTAFLALVLAPAMTRRWGKKQSMIALFIVSLLSGAAPVVLRLINLMPGNHAPALLPILMGFFFVTTTLGMTGLIMVASMMADVVEAAAVTTGRRSEGLLFSAHGLLHKCVHGVGTFLGGLVLTVVAFPRHAIQGQVDAATVWHLGLVMVIVMAICSPIAIVALCFYDIDRDSHQRNLLRLEELTRAALDEPILMSAPLEGRAAR